MRAMHRMQKDHPRVGGEKVFLIVMVSKTRGSPPRGRGKVDGGFLGGCGLGITPAWAGKRSLHLNSSALKWDHPRVGGEKHNHSYQQGLERGSPPRGRGKGCFFRPCPKRTGITPAWAGKSKICFYRWAITRDHPRVGGEKIIRMTTPKYPVGSPPRGRGKD